MIKRVVRFLCVVALLGMALPGFAWPQESSDVQALVDGNNLFAMDLYARMKDQPGNLIFSPYSISTALTMAYAGSGGNTAREMARVLHVTLEQDALSNVYAQYIKMFHDPQGYELAVANSLWGQKGYAVFGEFTELLKADYDGAWEEVDFAKAPVAAGVINTWVGDRTHGRIRDVIQPDSLNETTRLVLVNAVYFKGQWEKAFKKIHTQNGRFRVGPDDDKIVAMMNQQEDFFYTDNALAQILEMPYVGKDLAMMIVLPRKVDGLKELEGVLNIEDYNTWVKDLKEMKVDVTLPKFQNTASCGLVPALTAMGMPEAFSGDADFSGISDQFSFSISDVRHTVFVDVSEEGTEASAATADMSFTKLEPSTVVFIADHPFLYLIRDTRSGGILFMGRVMDPGVGPRPVGDVLGGMWGEVVGQALQAYTKNSGRSEASGH